MCTTSGRNRNRCLLNNSQRPLRSHVQTLLFFPSVPFRSLPFPTFPIAVFDTAITRFYDQSKSHEPETEKGYRCPDCALRPSNPEPRTENPEPIRFLLLVFFGLVWCCLVLFGPKIYFCSLT